MHLESVSHLFGDVVLQTHFSREWAEIRGALAVLAGDPPQESAHSPAHIRRLIARGLVASGWRSGAPVLVNGADRVDVTLRADFLKLGVVVELGFGPRDGLYRHLLTIQAAGLERLADVGVIILPTRRLGVATDRHMTFEQAVVLQQIRFGGMATPFVLLGLAH